MKKFLAVFTGTSSEMDKFMQLPEAARKEKTQKGVAAWKAWAEKHQKSIIEMGGPLSKTKRVDKKGIHDIRNNLGAFTVVLAETQEAAAKMFLEHPHFTIFPGDGVEIMEILAIPQG